MTSRFVEKLRRKTLKQFIKFVEFNIFRLTGKTIQWNVWTANASHPSSPIPDTVVLTPAADPSTMQTINWRTNTDETTGVVEYQMETEPDEPAAEVKSLPAQYKFLNMPELLTDQKTHHFTTTLTGLKPYTTYRYRAGNPQAERWSPWQRFTTGPEKGAAFSFAFLGDIQEGFPSVENAFRRIERDFPQTAFYLMAGDFVDVGEMRNQWDIFFAHSANTFAGKFLAPTPGNHDYHHIDPKGPVAYVSYFELPHNGPQKLAPNLTYAFAYSNAYFIIADTNQSLRRQTAWLEQQFIYARENYRWIFVLLHNPIYSSKGRTNKKLLRRKWVPLFDKYGIDIVFGGHDHSYMRTHKLYNGKPVADNASGTYYTVTTAGSRFYSYEKHDLAAMQIPRLQSFQIISIDKTNDGKDCLKYQAFDFEGASVDEFTISKTGGASDPNKTLSKIAGG